MSVDAIGENMPATPTLDDVARMMATDRHGHRYELSTEGVLAVVPPPESGHAMIATDLMLWLGRGGWTGDRMMQAAGVRLPGPEQDGGRIPDLALWTRPQPRDAVWLSVVDLHLVVEIISKGSLAHDQVIKVNEYAYAGIPNYWIVSRDSAQTVTMYRLNSAGGYEIANKVPFSWLLQSRPEDHGVGAQG